MALKDGPSDNGCTATITRLLNAVDAGDPRAAADLLPLVYEQLRALAARKMRQERPEQTLQATALVHEAYLRLVDETNVRQWDGRWHFFAAAAEAMRRILVENARRKGRLKRGGAGQRVSLDHIELTVDDPPDDLLVLDEALAAFAQTHPQMAQLVKLRYFAGLTMEEAAKALGISVSTAGDLDCELISLRVRHVASCGKRMTLRCAFHSSHPGRPGILAPHRPCVVGLPSPRPRSRPRRRRWPAGTKRGSTLQAS